MKTLAKGAEADLYVTDFSRVYFSSSTFSKIIIKKRIPKGYREPSLDLQLRRRRTLSEAKIIGDSREAGANVPFIIGVWQDECIIVMEKVEGVVLKEYLNQADQSPEDVCRSAGRQLGILHANGIIHGDPTTSNMIVRDGEVHLIDFGLAEYSGSLEKRAVDLHLLKTAMKSTHYQEFSSLYSACLRGYKARAGQYDQVLDRCRSIEKRGRYVDR